MRDNGSMISPTGKEFTSLVMGPYTSVNFSMVLSVDRVNMSL